MALPHRDEHRDRPPPTPASLRVPAVLGLAIDHLRRRRRFAFLPFSGSERDDRATFDVDADVVRSALRSVPPEQATALVLRLHEGFSRAEIAQLTGVSERVVKERLERGRESFAQAYRREVGAR